MVDQRVGDERAIGGIDSVDHLEESFPYVFNDQIKVVDLVSFESFLNFEVELQYSWNSLY